MKARHILVPTDFSEASNEAVKLAAKFVEKFDSTIDLIHVIPLMSYYDESMEHLGVPFDMEKDLYPKVLKTANEKMHEISEKFLPKEHRGQMINLVGRKPSQVIAEQVKSSQYDLILMSNTGGHGTKDERSNITEKVIRYSTKPVLSLNQAFDEEDIQEILVPVDGSDDSAAPLAEAFELAMMFDAKITLMHIIEPYSLGMEVLPMTIEDDKAVYTSLIKSIKKYFDAHPELNLSIEKTDIDFEDNIIRKSDNKVESIKVTSEVKKGFSAHTEIIDYAEEHADLVVMSTHGRTGIARVLLGSTTGIVAQHLKKPLLTLRPS
jgi:nucleotide-binding universal stress UspA family protein